MIRLSMALAACAALLAGPALATETKTLTPQQQKMAACNKEAAGKKLEGEERKKFMSECLKAKPVAATPQERMKVCNADPKAKELKGDERKKFMSECLKG